MNKYLNNLDKVFMDPTFRLMCFPLDGELDFNLKNDFH